MTEDEAKAWIADRHGVAAVDRLGVLVDHVRFEAVRQNLIAPSTIDHIWNRHIVDSAQLLQHAPDAGQWLDIGSGAGFPGMVLALLGAHHISLVEPRRRRATFLAELGAALAVSERVDVHCSRVESVTVIADVITARAVASLDNLFAWSAHTATPETRWILPKGKSAMEEVASAKRAWHGVFHVEHSITDPASMIILASGVTRR
ncbi:MULTISPECIES: 16S rRNA (guanine(527)-N(7))-methyltransferase RsmG [unclassified Sphingomonas]|uniref:16S rRNA (guanine(527)-N(7))-methyltransferase RsmG n=1 Tax=unclassified Sphingomonas TaxID=196159 RepID=UPI001F5A6C81|nr:MULTISPECIES: 16S rRNA (guanine(527)-N(7))-methyltransferase RsmG [unclassified Sphingomonas]